MEDYKSSRSEKKSYQVISLALFGNILEYFDFTLFAHFSLLIVPKFFPATDPIAASLQSLGLLAIGFLARPFGGWIFGRIGDKLGRKQGLSLSMLAILVPTLGIALLPTYESIGILATIFITLLRLGQGIALGGEYSNAAIFIIEHTPTKHHGFVSSIICASGSIGSLAALACVEIVNKSFVPSWGWRIPFLLAASLGLLAYHLRKKLYETPIFLDFQKKLKNQSPLTHTSWHTISCIFAIGAMTSLFVWIPVSYTSYYLTKIVGWPLEKTLSYPSLGLISFMIFLLITGFIADKIGLLKPMKIGLWLIILLVYPAFWLLEHQYITLFQILTTSFAGIFGATIHPIMMNACQIHQRCRYIGVFFTSGLSLFGGTAPFICAYLYNLNHNHKLVFLYITIIAVVSLGIIRQMKYTYPSSLTAG